MVLEELEAFLKSGSFDGMNVTIPYKKAVIPYCDLLTPLAEVLGVTVAELLACRRLEGQQPMDSNEVDHLVQKALHLSEGEADNLPRKKRVAQYLLFLCLGAAELGAVFALRRMLNDPLLLVPVLLGAVFGA